MLITRIESPFANYGPKRPVGADGQQPANRTTIEDASRPRDSVATTRAIGESAELFDLHIDHPAPGETRCRTLAIGEDGTIGHFLPPSQGDQVDHTMMVGEDGNFGRIVDPGLHDPVFRTCAVGEEPGAFFPPKFPRWMPRPPWVDCNPVEKWFHDVMDFMRDIFSWFKGRFWRSGY